MKKVIFCNVAYMKKYCGLDGDCPENGGKYIAENKEGGEIFNFLDYNGKCYGYFMHYGDKLSIDRIEGCAVKDDYVDDVLVVWVAKKSSEAHSAIVGWYENARVYKYIQSGFKTTTLGIYPDPEKDLYYNIESDANNCYLLRENMRNFVIPRAPKIGQGKGMGQSAIWYADSEFAKKEFIPKVVEYITKCEKSKENFINTVYTEKMLGKCSKAKKSVDELINEALDQNTPTQIALENVNAALRKEPSEDLDVLKASILTEYYRFSEALKLYEKAYKVQKDDSLLFNMFDMSILARQFDKAVVISEMIKNSSVLEEAESESKHNYYELSFHCYGIKGDLVKAQACLDELKMLTKDSSDRIDKMIDLYVK